MKVGKLLSNLLSLLTPLSASQWGWTSQWHSRCHVDTISLGILVHGLRTKRCLAGSFQHSTRETAVCSPEAHSSCQLRVPELTHTAVDLARIVPRMQALLPSAWEWVVPSTGLKSRYILSYYLSSFLFGGCYVLGLEPGLGKEMISSPVDRQTWSSESSSAKEARHI